MKLFKKSDIVPDINFAAKGLTVRYGTFKPEENNQIVINPHTVPRVLKVGYKGNLTCAASGKSVTVTDETEWRYHGKYNKYVEPYYY